MSPAKSRLSPRGFSEGLWFLATTIGWAAGWTAGWAVNKGLSLALVPLRPAWLTWAIPAALAGAIVGVGQLLVLRQALGRSSVWILATILAMVLGVGAGLAVLISGLRDPIREFLFEAIRSWTLRNLVPPLLGGAVGGIVGGSIQAIALTRLARPRIPEVVLLIAGWACGISAVGGVWYLAGLLAVSADRTLGILTLGTLAGGIGGAIVGILSSIAVARALNQQAPTALNRVST